MLAGQVTKMPHCLESLTDVQSSKLRAGAHEAAAPYFVGGLVGWAVARLASAPSRSPKISSNSSARVLT